MLMLSIDDGSGTIDINEFTECVRELKLPVGRKTRAVVRIGIAFALVICWLLLVRLPLGTRAKARDSIHFEGNPDGTFRTTRQAML
eukprot:SAG11_NODE_10912_length_797_cov_0.886819_2_plen_86_part_00